MHVRPSNCLLCYAAFVSNAAATAKLSPGRPTAGKKKADIENVGRTFLSSGECSPDKVLPSSDLIQRSPALYCVSLSTEGAPNVIGARESKTATHGKWSVNSFIFIHVHVKEGRQTATKHDNKQNEIPTYDLDLGT